MEEDMAFGNGCMALSCIDPYIYLFIYLSSGYTARSVFTNCEISFYKDYTAEEKVFYHSGTPSSIGLPFKASPPLTLNDLALEKTLRGKERWKVPKYG